MRHPRQAGHTGRFRGTILVIGLLAPCGRGSLSPWTTAIFRGRGIGRLLIERVATEAAARGYEYLVIRPVARNVDAIRRFYDAGFQTLGGHLDLTMDLGPRRHGWLDGAHLHDLEFRY